MPVCSHRLRCTCVVSLCTVFARGKILLRLESLNRWSVIFLEGNVDSLKPFVQSETEDLFRICKSSTSVWSYIALIGVDLAPLVIKSNAWFCTTSIFLSAATYASRDAVQHIRFIGKCQLVLLTNFKMLP